MTREELFKGTNSLLARKLSKEDVYSRLKDVYNHEIATQMINDAILCEVCIDSEKNIAVVYNEKKKTFIIIATGKNYDLVK